MDPVIDCLIGRAHPSSVTKVMKLLYLLPLAVLGVAIAKLYSSEEIKQSSEDDLRNILAKMDRSCPSCDKSKLVKAALEFVNVDIPEKEAVKRLFIKIPWRLRKRGWNSRDPPKATRQN